MLRDHACHHDNDGLRILQCRDHADLGHCITDNSNEDCNKHGDHNPYSCHSSGKLQLLYILNCHKTKQYMRHPKISKSPCQHGEDRQDSIR